MNGKALPYFAAGEYPKKIKREFQNDISFLLSPQKAVLILLAIINTLRKIKQTISHDCSLF